MYAQSMRRLVESMGRDGAINKLEECLSQGLLRAEDFSIRELAEAFVPQWAAQFTPGNAGTRRLVNVMEAGWGTDVTAFGQIVGQIFFNKIADGWERADRIGEKITTNFPTKLDGERIPWVSQVRGLGEEVQAGMPIPRVSFGERYVDTVRLQKQALIIDLQKETIFFDHTGQMMTASGKIGENLAYTKEEMILSVIAGCFNTYQLNQNTANTYQTASSPGTSPNVYVNSQSSTPLVNYNSINNYYALSTQILDPDSGLPIRMKPKHLLVMPIKLMEARRIVDPMGSAETIYPGTGAANPAVPGNVVNKTGNPLPDKLEVFTSAILYQMLINPPEGSAIPALQPYQANEYWWIGDLQQSFYWMENWPLQIETAPVGNALSFNQDILLSFKASFRGNCAVYEPRYSFRFSNQ